MCIQFMGDAFCNKEESFLSGGRKRWILSSEEELELVCTQLFRGSLHSCFGMDTKFKGRTWVSLHAVVQGKLAFMLWELFVSLEFVCALLFLPMVSSPFDSPWGVDILEHFVSVVLSCCTYLRGPILALSSDLILAFVWILITCLSSLFVSFFLYFMNWWLCVLSMH
jgi:hypothetical protein